MTEYKHKGNDYNKYECMNENDDELSVESNIEARAKVTEVMASAAGGSNQHKECANQEKDEG
eukprot:6385749-Karenia_brevis.AAC.1